MVKIADRPTIRSTGSEWLFTFDFDFGHAVPDESPLPALSIGVDHLRDNRDGLTAEVHIESLDAAGLLFDQPGPIDHAKLRILDPGTIDRWLEQLKRRKGGVLWDPLIRSALHHVVEEWRTPGETVPVRPCPPTGTAYLLRPLLVRGKTNIIHAPGATGKTFLARFLSLCLAGGWKVPGCADPGAPIRVVYVDGEMYREDNDESVWAILQGMGRGDPGGLYYRHLDGTLLDELPDIRFTLQDLDAELLVVDSLSWAVGDDLTDNVMATRFCREMDRVRGTKLILAHQTKEAAQDKSKQATIFGSVFYTNGARNVWELSRIDDGETVVNADGSATSIYRLVLHHQKPNKGRIHAPIGLESTFVQDPDGNAIAVQYRYFDATKDPSALEKASVGQRVLAALSTRAKTVTELSEELQKGDGNIRSTLNRLAQNKRVVKFDRSGLTYWGVSA